jgi:hypothetical protein
MDQFDIRRRRDRIDCAGIIRKCRLPAFPPSLDELRPTGRGACHRAAQRADPLACKDELPFSDAAN